MNYQETISYLYNRMPLFQIVGTAGYKPGIEGMVAFDNYLGNPHKSFKTIHVAGTNGKGSVSHTLASVLQSAGYKVGLFTSPHLKDFRERIRVNGEMMSEQYVIDFVEKNSKIFDVIYPSFFEVCVAMAFDYFREQRVDVAVIEVGLGGRLDSTNIITPELSVITNISFDHMNLLGNTLPEIAGEKAGIIKQNVPVVVGEAGEDDVRSVFENKAKEVSAPIHFAEEEVKVENIHSSMVDNNPMLSLTMDGFEVSTPLMGIYQQKNMPTAFLAIKYLRKAGFTISDEAIKQGYAKTIEQTHLMGRWQKLGDKPLTLCDTGHNEAGIKMIVEQLSKMQYKKLRIVYGVMKDKDVAHILPLLPITAEFYFTRAKTPRAMPQDELFEKATKLGYKGKAYPTVAEALAAARAEADADDLVFVGGSTYVVAEIV